MPDADPTAPPRATPSARAAPAGLRRHGPLAFAVAYALLYEAARRLVGDDLAGPVTNVGLVPMSVFAAVLAARLAWNRRGRAASHAWGMLAASFAVAAVGDVGWWVTEDLLGGDPSSALANHIPYFAQYLLVFVAMVSFPDVLRTRAERTRLFLDVGVVFIAGVTAIWRFVLSPQLTFVSGQTEADLLPLAHPIGDLLVFLGVVLLILRRPASVARRAVLLLGIGFFVMFAGDVLWAALELRGVYATGGLSDSAWLASTLLLVAASEAQRLAPVTTAGARSTPRPLAGISPLPYVAAGSAYLILLVEAWRGEMGNGVDLVTGVVGLTSFVIARQLFAVRENARLWSERATLVSDARLSALVRNAADAVVVVTPDGVIAWASDSTLRVLGRDAAELPGRPLAELVTTGHREELARVLATAAAAPAAPLRGEWDAATRPGGSPRRVEAIVSNLLDDAVVRGLVVNLRDVTDRANLERQLTHQAFHDSLTGLSNRALFRDRVQQALARAPRSGRRVAVCFVDLDDFKTVNDGLGHGAGDLLLVQVARRLRAATRTSDTAARLGGDEFAVLAEELDDVDDALALGHRLGAAFREPFDLDGRRVHVSASTGIAVADALDTEESILRNADTAMYAAKARRRGGAELFEPGMHTIALENIEVQTALRSAVARGEMRLVYQPIVALASGRVVGHEALLRWTHPTRGEIGPKCFVPLAEASGAIVPIGRWVLEQALTEVARATRDGRGTSWMSVNVSGRQLEDPAFAATVASLLAATGVAPDRLCLEFTESVLLRDSESLRATFTELRRLGVRLGLDDFGTGYSSLGYLRSFALDVLKIPREFVEQVGSPDGTPALAHSIVALADALDLRVVAEGVETLEQAHALRRMGCEMAQGWYFGRPSPTTADSEPRYDAIPTGA